MVYNEIYCDEKYAEAVSAAIAELARQHPEWELSDGTWDKVEDPLEGAVCDECGLGIGECQCEI